MLIALYIFVDDEFDMPVYADPDPEELDEGVWEAVCEAANDALEGDARADGTTDDQPQIAWKHLPRTGLTFVVVTEDVKPLSALKYLNELAKRYLDEVTDARHPELDGVADVVVDVIPPWEDEDE